MLAIVKLIWQSRKQLGQDSEKDVTVDTRIHEPDSDGSLIEETFNDSPQLAPVDTTDLFDNASNLNPELSQANEVNVRKFFKTLITVQFILISVKGYARKKENRGECYTFRKDYFIILDMDCLNLHERQLASMDMGCLTP